MGVNINQYLMYGAMLDSDEYETLNGDDDFNGRLEQYEDSSAYKKEVKHHNGLFCCHDISSGKWAVIGRCIEKTNDHSLLAENAPCCIQSTLSLSERKKVAKAIKEHLPEISGKPLNFYLITQYR